MGELDNCKSCNALFVRTTNDVCSDCLKKEEKQFQIVYAFMRKRVNRQATVQQIVEGTGVEEALILKFVKERRLRASQFPNLAYPCEKCGKTIQDGKLCADCSQELANDLAYQEKIDQIQLRNEESEREKVRTYYAIDRTDKKN
ncbi:TIGR03826 family flagellar region protein [Paraliobacillus sp. JSM ZJ581]|uniref:TIGR03826 family flagellar region protein n=1 Tax=Paraliobacillus sp. JSM ZJ581 TaxID=3342118 RepID=UPI0035A8C2AB